MEYPMQTRPTVLVVDDVPHNIDVLRAILHPEYRVIAANSGEKALRLCQQANAQQQPDLILLDVMMPEMDGHEVCRRLKADPRTARIPIIFVTARDDEEDEEHGFERGAVDYLTKPVKPRIVLARVHSHLALSNQQRILEDMVQQRTQEVRRTQLKIVRNLAQAAEFRDNETGMHTIRMSFYARALAESLGMESRWVEILFTAAPMHDIGKIGIPDAILMKQGKLTVEEFDFMKKHTTIGARIIGDPEDSDLLKLASSVAMTHHEKWNGTGYPNGLIGEAIPIEGRICAVADVFDALTSTRPYKRAWTTEEAVDFFKKESGQHFDPDLIAHFMGILPLVEEIKHHYED